MTWYRPASTHRQEGASSWHRYRVTIVLIARALAAFQTHGLQSLDDADDARFILSDQTFYLVPFMNI